MLRIASTLLAALSLAACATNGPAEPVAVDTYCGIAEPIFLDHADVLTEGTLRQVVRENEKGRDRCGWKPPHPKPAPTS